MTDGKIAMITAWFLAWYNPWSNNFFIIVIANDSGNVFPRGLSIASPFFGPRKL